MHGCARRAASRRKTPPRTPAQTVSVPKASRSIPPSRTEVRPGKKQHTRHRHDRAAHGAPANTHRRRHQGLGATAGDHRVHEHRGDPVPERGPFVYFGGGRLGDRLRLAGERRLLHLQRRRRQQAAVRGYPVTGLNRDHITGMCAGWKPRPTQETRHTTRQAAARDKPGKDAWNRTAIPRQRGRPVCRGLAVRLRLPARQARHRRLRPAPGPAGDRTDDQGVGRRGPDAIPDDGNRWPARVEISGYRIRVLLPFFLIIKRRFAFS